MAGVKKDGGTRGKAAVAPPPPEEGAVHGESPVIGVLAKRLRALRKRLQKLAATEVAQVEGAALLPEQVRRGRGGPALPAPV